MPIILTTWKVKNNRIMVGGQLGQIGHKTPISKIITSKWTGGVTQVVEYLLCKCLLCKHEALSSNPIPLKNPKSDNCIPMFVIALFI
jgi:hypothetical protein